MLYEQFIFVYMVGVLMRVFLSYEENKNNFSASEAHEKCNNIDSIHSSPVKIAICVNGR